MLLALRESRGSLPMPVRILLKLMGNIQEFGLGEIAGHHMHTYRQSICQSHWHGHAG
jgi:hypothetical protein